MRSEKQTQASRANGARSKRPASEPGKRNSSRDGTRHGLLAHMVVLEKESGEAFNELLTALTEEHQPGTPTQSMLVETMAAARWRLLRIWGIQKVAMDREIALMDPSVGPPCVRAIFAFSGSLEISRRAELLLRHEVALDRQFNRALRQLIALQSQPSPEHPKPAPPVCRRSTPADAHELAAGAPRAKVPGIDFRAIPEV